MRESPNKMGVVFHVSIEKDDGKVLGLDGINADQKTINLIRTLEVGRSYTFPECINSN